MPNIIRAMKATNAQCQGLNQVVAVLSKPITAATATNLANYSISGTNGLVTILGAALDVYPSNVVLSVNGLINGDTYTLTVNNLAAQTPEKVVELEHRANELAATMAKPLFLETEFKALLQRLGMPPALPDEEFEFNEEQ